MACSIFLGALPSVAFENGVNPTYEAPKVYRAPTIDGVANDREWKSASWRDVAYTIIDAAEAGEPAAEDISGRYKVVWTRKALYLLAEIKDDRLSDDYPSPFDNWWNEDTLEIFIDEDNSGGYHGWDPVADNPMAEHNAYAYHIGLDNQALDIGPNASLEVGPQLYPEHIRSSWKRDPESHSIIWEVEIKVFDDQYLPGMSQYDLLQSRQMLKAGKTMGFMVSLIDADGVDLNGSGGQDREYFMGDVDVPVWQAEDGGFPMPDWMGKNRGWVDAGVFGNLKLVKIKK